MWKKWNQIEKCTNEKREINKIKRDIKRTQRMGYVKGGDNTEIVRSLTKEAEGQQNKKHKKRLNQNRYVDLLIDTSKLAWIIQWGSCSQFSTQSDWLRIRLLYFVQRSKILSKRDVLRTIQNCISGLNSRSGDCRIRLYCHHFHNHIDQSDVAAEYTSYISNEYPAYNTKQSDGEAPVIPSLPGPL